MSYFYGFYLHRIFMLIEFVMFLQKPAVHMARFIDDNSVFIQHPKGLKYEYTKL